MFFSTIAVLAGSYFLTVHGQSEVKWNLLEMEMGMDMSTMQDMAPEEIVHMMMEDHPLPEPNVTYTMDNGDHLCMNENITYLSIDWEYAGCNVDFDMNGTNVLPSSYIEIINSNNNDEDLLSQFYIGQILMEHVYMMDYMDNIMHNCTMTPVMKIVDIVYFDELNIIRLYFIEPQLQEYMNLLDTNLTNKNLYDLNNIYYMEPMDKLKNELIYNNITNSSVTLNEFICYEYNENGDIIGEVDQSNCISESGSIITEMGSQYGNNGFIDKNSTDIQRRRLFFGRLKVLVTKVVNVVKEVVNKVVDFVETLIDIVTGNIDERFTLGRLQISESSNFILEGELKERETANGKGTLNGNGRFSVEAGANFDLHTYIDFSARYELFSFNPSFDEMRIAIITELLLDAYLNLNINGELNLEYELFKLGKRKIFFIGPIPVIVNLFSDLTALLDINIDVSLSLNAGLERIFFEYGAEYIKGDGWKEIRNSNLNLIPYYNIGSTLNDNENNDVTENSCFSVTFTPALRLRFGVVLYELITIYNAYTFNNEISLQYPYNCENGQHCNGNPSLGFTMDTYLDISIGIEIGNDKYGLDAFEYEYSITTIDINQYENCINTFIAPLYYPCCGYPDTLFPTISPTKRPTIKPTPPTYHPTPAPTSFQSGCKYIKSHYFNHWISASADSLGNGQYSNRMYGNSGSNPSSSQGRFIFQQVNDNNVFVIYASKGFRPGYWQATPNGELNADTQNRYAWEQFQLLKSNACEKCYYIRSVGHNKLIAARPVNQNYERLWADSSNYLSWERFEIHDC